MEILKQGEKLIEKELDFTSGTIGWGGVNDAYDLYLVEDGTKNLTLIIFMKIQFNFKDSKNLVWTNYEKIKFVTTFETEINAAWGKSRLIKTLPSGKSIFIDFRFESLIDKWSVTEHWEINVTKIAVGSFRQSSINPILGTGDLDSEDVSLVGKGHGMFQRGIVHEFGHMLGHDDEYQTSSKYAKDYKSVMNSGESILKRHDSAYIGWLDKVIKNKNIK